MLYLLPDGEKRRVTMSGTTTTEMIRTMEEKIIYLFFSLHKVPPMNREKGVQYVISTPVFQRGNFLFFHVLAGWGSIRKIDFALKITEGKATRTMIRFLAFLSFPARF